MGRVARDGVVERGGAGDFGAGCCVAVCTVEDYVEDGRVRLPCCPSQRRLAASVKPRDISVVGE